jgi:pimeloyl-ACP methyl ester carboxylesterase
MSATHRATSRKIQIRPGRRQPSSQAGSQYLQDPEVQRTARGLVVAQIGLSTRVVVAHDLGSVVAYEALCDHPELNVETFITLGSPIGQPNVSSTVWSPRRATASDRGREASSDG